MAPMPFQFIEAQYLSEIIKLQDENESLKNNKPMNNWIPVSHKLPNENGWYLVVKFNQIRVAEWSTDSWYNENDTPIDNEVITHWQPLPNLPDKES